MKYRGERIVVIGAGLAGAASAFGLTRRGVRDVVVLEQESIPGYYASGRNAAMVRQLSSAPEVRRLIRRGLEFFAAPPQPFPAPLEFRRSGSVLTASGSELAELSGWVEAEGPAMMVRFLSPAVTRALTGVINPASMEAAAFTTTDGVVDIHGLLQGFLSGARAGGAEVRFRARVDQLLVNNQRVVGVRTDGGEVIKCGFVVNAAGPWAGQVAELGGAMRLPFLTLRRHLSQTAPAAAVDPAGPIVWDLTHGVYFRPESGGVLLSGCDESPIGPCDPAVDAAEIERLADKVAHHLPGLKDAELIRTWACIRTFVADRRMVLGTDPLVQGFFWAAALGGNGVALAPAISELVPDLLLEGRSSLLDDLDLQRVTPERFLS